MLSSHFKSPDEEEDGKAARLDPMLAIVQRKARKLMGMQHPSPIPSTSPLRH